MSAFITAPEFMRAVRDLSEILQKSGAETWAHTRLIEQYGEVGLRVKSVSILRQPDEAATGEALDEDIEDTDDERLSSARSSSLHTELTFDIIHSASYQVPVLYMTTAPEKLIARLKQKSMLAAGEIREPISFADHPWTGLPVHFIHPCRTAETIRTISAGSTYTPLQYMVTWFGLVVPMIGLSLPLEVAACAAENLRV